MAEVPNFLLVHAAAVRTRTEGDEWGPGYSGAVDVAVNASTKSRMVRDEEGEETVSSLTLITRVEHESKFTPGSKVTVLGRDSRVLHTVRADDGGLGGWQHLQVVCE